MSLIMSVSDWQANHERKELTRRGLTEHRLPRTNKAVLVDRHVPTFLCCCYARQIEFCVLPTFLYCVPLPQGATAVPLAHFVSSAVASTKLASCRVLLFQTVLARLVVVG